MQKTNYFTNIKKNTQVKDIYKKSRFITIVKEVEKEAEVRDFLREIKNQFPDASHHCWAYKIGVNDEQRKQYSDAGEPVNSAGPPILQAIEQEGLVNVMIIIVRYFGGIKLGISGLVKAYRESALHGLQSAGTVRKVALREFILEHISYLELGRIIQAIESRGGRIAGINYDEKISISVHLSESKKTWLTNTLKSISHGKAIVKTGQIKWYKTK